MLLAAGAWVVPLPAAAQPAEEEREERVRRLLETLAHDSLRGRRAGSPDARSAARILADRLRAYGVEPAGGRGFLHPVPLVRTEEGGLALADDGREADLTGHNVVGVVRGRAGGGADQAVVVGAHFDHLGVGTPVAGDSIYNGADDDASGVVAVLEAARVLASGAPPERTVIFALFTAEEAGLLGTLEYLEDPAVPLDRTVANLQVEMIARSDPLLEDEEGLVWLTGFERSTMGRRLADEGVPVVPDPRPQQRFFFRSDNIAFARRGIPAHTLSSYGMHDDYHRPSDDVGAVEWGHFSRAVDAVVRAVRVLSSGPAPRWNPGGRP